ncbi:hypothetical protein CA13_04500 [Planctomycetes bacterium CA13]|uniref:Conserved hypothetical protein CHP03032 domain-containing protein n=1 Tax=Novipirellula herctigrandis TaxID=2527986 RepID=A0A5C5YWX7_9BACT|nr:hypothetical protein CA13_04500 [Planctomycetes bacterium CA13]
MTIESPLSRGEPLPPGEPLGSVHTSNFPEILNQLGISLLLTTYQAGKLIVVRADNDVLNTHFRVFDQPMGLAVQKNRIAVGTAMQIWEFHNLPAACTRLDQQPNSSGQRHDACFLPRVVHWTGDVQIHEMAWAGEELIFVNTRFSCLARRSTDFHFEPVWRPPFVSHFAPTDCCHLNGLATRDGTVCYVTAFGATNDPSGWRAKKNDGGVMIDVQTNQTIAADLSMPHSPRWYDGKLWVLQSGTGGFGFIDLANGTYQSVVELPGFTRGLSFCGPFAFIGLSQVRETAVFGGVPIAQRNLNERICGIWVVNIHSGQIVAFVKFEGAVQEIFSVEVLSGARFPELVNEDRELLANSYSLPDWVLADLPSTN